MPKFIINGGQTLKGEITVEGAKNNAQIMLPVALLSDGTITITNLPNIDGVDKSLELLKDLGAEIELEAKGVKINTKNVKKIELDYKLADKFRTSVMFVGPLLARYGEVKFPHPGGCVIGAAGRPIDLFLETFAKMG
ncbi:MAG: UDP-N-acetylglucosamine 1-carboxyvinyltransferase, partial [Candidatus Falkowbacteria bacterium]|nr:UDP-N-acetylglucosamine 1-carboxyvinyltransferase [Candidatus Falkowbacteria bacterium]